MTTRTEMTEGMRVWTSPRPEGNVMKIRVTSAWMSCTSPLQRPGKGGRLKMRTASKRYRRSIRFFFSTNIYWVVIKEYFYFRLHFHKQNKKGKFLMHANLKRKKKGKSCLAFVRKLKWNRRHLNGVKWLGYLNPLKALFVVKTGGGFLEKENSVIKYIGMGIH